MRDDQELRELRERVRVLDQQLAASQRGAGPASCAIVMVAVLGVLVLAGGGVAFLVLRSIGPAVLDPAETERQARAQAERDARDAEAEAHIASLEAQLAQLRLAAPATPDPAYVDDDAVYDGHVTHTEGASHLHVGDSCRVDVEWTTDPGRNCRALIDCGTRHVYGDVHQGWFPCVSNADGVQSGEDTEPTADDGDPRFSIDRTQNTVTVSDDGPSWSVTMSLAERPEEE